MIDNLSIVGRSARSFMLMQLHYPGFLLIECMVALVVLMTCVATISWYQWQAVYHAACVRKHMQALTCASSMLDTVIARGSRLTSEVQEQGKDGITLTAHTHPVPSCSAVPLRVSAHIQGITVTASWLGPAGNRHLITLHSCMLAYDKGHS